MELNDASSFPTTITSLLSLQLCSTFKMAPVATQNASHSSKYSTTVRLADTDPAFDNSITHLVSSVNTDQKLNAHGVPYTIHQTYRAPDGDRMEYLRKTQGMTTLQRHVAYFDGNLDGVITMQGTFLGGCSSLESLETRLLTSFSPPGFYAMGFGIILSILAMFIIHGPFSYPTLPYDGSRWWHYLPDPRMRIYIANIHRCKHGSDTDSYDRRGDLNKDKFEDIIRTYSSAAGRDALYFSDLLVILRQRRHLMDLFG